MGGGGGGGSRPVGQPPKHEMPTGREGDYEESVSPGQSIEVFSERGTIGYAQRCIAKTSVNTKDICKLRRSPLKQDDGGAKVRAGGGNRIEDWG